MTPEQDNNNINNNEETSNLAPGKAGYSSNIYAYHRLVLRRCISGRHDWPEAGANGGLSTIGR